MRSSSTAIVAMVLVAIVLIVRWDIGNSVVPMNQGVHDVSNQRSPGRKASKVEAIGDSTHVESDRSDSNGQ